MTNKFIAFIISILTLITSLSYSQIKTDSIPDESGFKPILRFAVMSDTHINTVSDKRAKKMLTTIKIANKIAEESKDYSSLDAVIFDGDLTDNGRKTQFFNFKALLNASVNDDTQILPIMAKGHDGKKLGKESLEYFASLTDFESDFHKVINGIHFIGISASKTGETEYIPEQRTWLDNQLKEAVKDGNNKPVFVFHHEHVKNTVYGSRDVDGWGIDYFKDIFEKYPQIIHFSGHSHYPLNDPRSIWQGKFTAIGTGEIYYLEFTVDDENQIHPKGNKNEAQFWIVEVNKDNVIRLRGIDSVEQKVLCEYYLNGALSRDYTPEKRESQSSAPRFTNNAIGIKKGISKATFRFNAADSTDGMPVILYRAIITDIQGNEISSDYIIPDYYSATKADEFSIQANKPDKGSYTVKIFAENAYGMKSEPIQKDFTVK